MMVETVETLICGAGPVGLFLAEELLRRGHSCVLVERNAHPSMHSKALAIMPGTMELFARAGLEREFLGAANRIEGVRFVTPRRSAFVPFCDIASQYNFVSILPQWKTQQLLAQRVMKLGGDVRYGWTLTDLRERGEGGVEATLITDAGERTIRARYLAGCDGIGSTVRELAGIACYGEQYPGEALLADVTLKTAVPPSEARVYVNSRGVVTMFAMSETVRRVVVIAPRERLPECAERAWLQERLETAGCGGTQIGEVAWSNTFRVQRRVADAMRRGSVVLAGDSVHTHSPVGGQGMNVGLRDAWTLAEKLTQVLSNTATDALLDDYERERLPVARAVVRRTHLLTSVLAHPHPFLRVARERVGPAIAGLPLVYKPLIRRLALTA